MKKKFAALIYLLLCTFYVSSAFGAQATTPNLGMVLPDYGTPGWGTILNNNFSILDTKFPQGVFALFGVYNQGAILPGRNYINFNGAGISCGDNSINNRIDCTVTSGGGGGGGHVILEESSPLTQRSKLSILGTSSTCVDNAGNDSTDCTFQAYNRVMNEGSNLTQRATINFIGTGVDCVDNAGSTRTDCTISAAAVDQAANYVWTGTHSWRDGNFSILNSADTSKIFKIDLSGQTTGTTRIYTFPNASTRLIGDSDFSATGVMVRTAANTYAARTITGTTGNIAITPDGGGLGGNINIDLGTTAVQTDQSNTYTTGDQNMAGAASWTMPTQTGATPTGAGRLAFDSTALRPKYGNGTSAFTIASTADLATLQSLSANLTALSGLTGVSGGIPYFTGPGAMGVAQMVLCVNAGGNVLHVSSLSPLTFTCDASATGGLSGGTNNQALFATGATTFASSANLTRSAGGVIQMPNGIEVGSVGTDSWTPDASAFVGHGATSIVLPWVGASPSFVLSTGAKTSGHVVKWDASGAAIDGGVAGVGDVTLAGPNTMLQTTIVDLGTADATGNAITTPIFASFEGGSLTPDGTNCTDATKQTINSGPTQYAFVCPTPNSAIFDAALIGIKNAVTTIRVRLKANDTASATALAGTFKAQCRASGTAPNSTWGSTQTVAITLTTANNTYEGLTTAITPNGTCSAGADLYIRYNATGGSNVATTRILGLVIEQLS